MTRSVKAGYIYIITGSALLKVGRSRQPKKRLADLQGANGGHLRMARTWHVKDSADVETRCHLALNKWRVRGEWFSCALNVAIAEIEGIVNGPDSRLHILLKEEAALDALWAGENNSPTWARMREIYAEVHKIDQSIFPDVSAVLARSKPLPLGRGL